MNKSKYFHPFIKWHYILGQKSFDLKEEKYAPSEEVKKIVSFYHEQLHQKMVEIQKAHLERIGVIIIEMKTEKYFALRRMCNLKNYQSILDISRGKKKSFSESDLLEFRKTSWERYTQHKITNI